MDYLWPSMLPTLRNLTRHEIVTIWYSVCEYIQEYLVPNKGVRLLGVGTFYVLAGSQCTVNGEVFTVHRPMFRMSDVLAKECGLSGAQEDIPADVRIVSLRNDDLAAYVHMPFATVQGCLQETAIAFYHALSHRKHVDFVFNSIGILSIRNLEVTMRFYDDFLSDVDRTGKLLEALLASPETRHLVVPESGGAAFRMGADCVFVLPQLDLKYPWEFPEMESPSKGSLEVPDDDQRDRKASASGVPAEEQPLPRTRRKKKKGKGKRSKSWGRSFRKAPKAKDTKAGGKQTDGKGRLLSRERAPLPMLYGASKKGGQEGWGSKVPSSLLKTTEEWAAKVEEPGRGASCLTSTHGAAGRVCRHLMRAEHVWQHLNALPRLHKPHPPEVSPEEERRAAARLRRAQAILNKLESRPCVCEEQLSIRATRTLQLLDTYHAHRNKWKRVVELNRWLNTEEKHFLCPGHQMTLHDQKERYQDLLAAQKTCEVCRAALRKNETELPPLSLAAL